MKTLSVKNFEQFQHYKDRTPPWIKLYNELLDDYEFAALPDASKWHLVAIWLLASRSDNRIPHDAQWISRRINASGRVDLTTLIESGFLVENQELHDTEKDASRSLAKRLSREETEGEKRQNNARELALEFEKEFWPSVQHKVGKATALKAYQSARQRASKEDILAGYERYAANKLPDQRWCNPATFLNGDRWLDEPAPGPKPDVRHNGSGVYIRKGSRQWQAWEHHGRKVNDWKMLDSMKAVPDGGERKFLAEWPSKAF